MNRQNFIEVIKFAFVIALLAFPVNAHQGSKTKIKVVAYNVACGQWASPEQIGEVLKPLKPDIVLLSEVPKANRGKKVKDWSHRLADALDLEHVHVGTVSSANHKAPKCNTVAAASLPSAPDAVASRASFTFSNSRGEAAEELSSRD